MRDIKQRQIKSQESDRNRSQLHHDSIYKNMDKNGTQRSQQVQIENLNIESALKSHQMRID